MNTPQLSWRERAIARLEHLVPTWFALVMGWCGLAQAWLVASDNLGDVAFGFGAASAAFALGLFVVLSVLCVLRLQAHPQAVAADLRHPVRHAFMGTLPVSLLLLASLGIQLLGGLSDWGDTALTFVWCLGSLLEIVATVWVVSRWLQGPAQGGLQWASFTPVFFIPVVGNVLAPLGGVPLGLEMWATAQLGVGVLLWPVLQTLLFVRVAQAGPLPAAMTPSWFITLVPPSAIGLSLLVMDAPLPLVWALWGIGAFTLALVLTQIKAIQAQGFGLGFWAMSFPVAAFTVLTQRLSQDEMGAWLATPALLMLAVTTLLILALTVATWRGLSRGQLLVPQG